MQVRPAVCTAMALAGVLVLTTHAGAVVRVDKSGISGPIDPAGGRAIGSIQYVNTTDFMVVITTASTQNGDYNPTVGPPIVRYNGQAFTQALTGSADHGSCHVHYLANPVNDGEAHTLTVEFKGSLDEDVDIEADHSGYSDNFQFGVLSLSGVETADPVVTTYGPGPVETSTHDELADEDLNAGDFLVVANALINRVHRPNYETGGTDPEAADGNPMVELFLTTADEGGNGWSQAHYRTLTPDDIDDAGKVRVDALRWRDASIDGGVVFNAVATIEPAEGMLFGPALLFLVCRIRHRPGSHEVPIPQEESNHV